MPAASPRLLPTASRTLWAWQGGVWVLMPSTRQLPPRLASQLCLPRTQSGPPSQVPIRRTPRCGPFCCTTLMAWPAAPSFAESVIAFIFSLAKRLPYLDRNTREGNWRQGISMTSVNVHGKVVGSIGGGNIGGPPPQPQCPMCGDATNVRPLNADTASVFLWLDPWCRRCAAKDEDAGLQDTVHRCLCLC